MVCHLLLGTPSTLPPWRTSSMDMNKKWKGWWWKVVDTNPSCIFKIQNIESKGFEIGYASILVNYHAFKYFN